MKKSYIALAAIGLVIFIGLMSFTTIFLYKRGSLNFLVDVYQIFDKPPVDIDYTTQDNLALFYEAGNLTPILRVRNDNTSEFMEWKEEAREKFIEILGIRNFGVLNSSSVKEISIENIGDGIIRKEISFVSYDGVEIPCYLFVHDDGAGDAKRPAIIIISGHGGGIVETAGLEESYQHGNAEFLAREGYVTITCDNRGMGKLNRIHHAFVFANAVAIGRSYQGVILDDHMQAVSILEELEQVDDERIGAAGVSLGGEQAMYLAAIDDRIKAAAVFGWLSDYSVMFHRHTSNWAIPGLLAYFDQESIGSMIAPKPVLYSNGAEESKATTGPGWINTEDGQETMIEIEKTYKLFSGSYVEYEEHPGGHEFNNEMAAEFFENYL